MDNQKDEQKKISSRAFYNEYHGHKVDHLQILLDYSKEEKKTNVFLAGDSSLDNKHWILNLKEKSINGYEKILVPDESVVDICYNLNKVFEEEKSNYFCINCAVEESTIGDRDNSTLLKQDQVIQKYITKNDILIVSIGGNDIALRPSVKTIMKMLWLAKMSSIDSIRNGSAWGLGYFTDMFKGKIEAYLENMCPKENRPKKILVCMIYYPHEKLGSWADFTLKMLGYNSNPDQLKSIISSVFELATKNIKISGSEVIPVKLFEILDCRNDSEDYVQRVEPSDIGGLKMARAFYDLIKN